MSMDDLERALGTGIAPLYVVLAPSEFLLNRAAVRIIESAMGPGAADFNLDRFRAGQDNLSAVPKIARTYPMMARRRVVRISSAENLKGEDLTALTELAREKMDHCTLVLTGQSLDKRVALIKVAKEVGGLFDFGKLGSREIAGWAVRMAKDLGKTLSADAASFLAQQLGTDLERIQSEIEKASLYVGADKTQIDAADVQAVMVAVKTESVFDLTDAVGEKNRAKAFFFLDGMLETGNHPIRIHATLYRHMRKLLAVKELAEQGRGADEIARELGAHPFVAGKMETQARRYRREDLRLALLTLSRSDFDLKNSRASDRVVLERMILALCASRG